MNSKVKFGSTRFYMRFSDNNALTELLCVGVPRFDHPVVVIRHRQ